MKLITLLSIPALLSAKKWSKEVATAFADCRLNGCAATWLEADCYSCKSSCLIQLTNVKNGWEMVDFHKCTKACKMNEDEGCDLEDQENKKQFRACKNRCKVAAKDGNDPIAALDAVDYESENNPAKGRRKGFNSGGRSGPGGRTGIRTSFANGGKSSSSSISAFKAGKKAMQNFRNCVQDTCWTILPDDCQACKTACQENRETNRECHKNDTCKEVCHADEDALTEFKKCKKTCKKSNPGRSIRKPLDIQECLKDQCWENFLPDSCTECRTECLEDNDLMKNIWKCKRENQCDGKSDMCEISNKVSRKGYRECKRGCVFKDGGARP